MAEKFQLVIAEKPSVAASIAKVLGAGENRDGFFSGNGFLVSWCYGHLVEPASPGAYGIAWKKWSYESLPMIPPQWQMEVKAETKGQFLILKGLMRREDVSEIIEATDAGREGELIFRLVYEKAGCSKPIKRLWISSLEEKSIREGFENLKPGSDYESLYESALCRQRADWLVGLNCTRLFTILYGGRLLRVGRVQTPTLAMLVEREEQIRSFKKKPYYSVHILADGIDAVSERIAEKEKAKALEEACRNQEAHVSRVTGEEKTVQPPKLYDLTTLQRDANRIFGFTAKQTLEYTQSLYEQRLVTYPRTDSQYLSDDMEETAKSVIEAVCKAGLFEMPSERELSLRRILDGRKVTDHHAIIPTGEVTSEKIDKLPEGERKVLSLAACRLMCATGTAQVINVGRIEMTCAGTVFTASGKGIVKNGWKEYEDAFRSQYQTGRKEADKMLPKVAEGTVFQEAEVKVSEQFTQPPKHFTEDALLSAMERAGAEEMGDDVERKGLGTPATRADIIEKLVHDRLAERKERQILPTQDGVKLITILPDVVKSPLLTAQWENALTLVAKGEYPMQKFMDGIEDMVKGLVETYHSISEEEKTFFEKASEKGILGKCPKCGGDVVSGKYGAYCKDKCGMNVGRALGAVLTDSQIKSLLDGRKTLVKGLSGKKGKFDAYLIPDGITEYTYVKDGKEVKAAGYHVKLAFPKPMEL